MLRCHAPAFWPSGAPTARPGRWVWAIVLALCLWAQWGACRASFYGDDEILWQQQQWVAAEDQGRAPPVAGRIHRIAIQADGTLQITGLTGFAPTARASADAGTSTDDGSTGNASQHTQAPRTRASHNPTTAAQPLPVQALAVHVHANAVMIRGHLQHLQAPGTDIDPQLSAGAWQQHTSPSDQEEHRWAFAILPGGTLLLGETAQVRAEFANAWGAWRSWERWAQTSQAPQPYGAALATTMPVWGWAGLLLLGLLVVALLGAPTRLGRTSPLALEHTCRLYAIAQ